MACFSARQLDIASISVDEMKGKVSEPFVGNIHVAIIRIPFSHSILADAKARMMSRPLSMAE